MTEAKYTQADLDAVCDNAKLTAQQVIEAKPFAEVFPEFAAELETVQRLRGRAKAVSPKVSTTLRLDPDVVRYFRSTGAGWQSRINEALRRAANL